MPAARGRPVTYPVCIHRLQPLPWEEDPKFFTKALEPSAAAFVADLLRRNPEARKPIRTVIHSPMFEPVFRDSAFDTNLATASSRSLTLGTFSNKSLPRMMAQDP